MPDKIQIFGKDAWPYTRAAREAFAKEDRQVDYYNVVKDAKNLETMLTYSKGTRKVPVIVEGKTVTIGFEGGTWGVWFPGWKPNWRTIVLRHSQGDKAVLDTETAEETHEALKLRVGELERKIGEPKQAEKTLLALVALDKGKLYADVRRELTERKRTEATLRESEQRYRLLLESSPDPIVLYNIQGKVTYVNPAFEQTFGFSDTLHIEKYGIISSI